MTSPEAITDFLKELQSYAGDMERIKAACERLVADLYKVYSANSVHAYLTKYRNMARQWIDKDMLPYDVLLVLCKPKEKREERRNATANQLTTKRQQQIKVPDFDTIRDLGLQLIASGSYIENTLGLMIFTGRRPIELLKVGHFTATNNPYEIFFQGQAKKRQEGRSKKEQDDITSFPIPVFIKSDIIINAWLNLRAKKDFSQVENTTVNSTVSKTVGEAYRKHFDTYLPDTHAYSLRALYAIYAYFYPTVKEGRSMGDFIKGLLGHDKHDNSSSAHYEAFDVMEFHKRLILASVYR